MNTFQNLSVSSPAPVTIDWPSGDMACKWIDEGWNKCFIFSKIHFKGKVLIIRNSFDIYGSMPKKARVNNQEKENHTNNNEKSPSTQNS